MLEYVEGRVVERAATHVVVEVGGMAFRVSVPLSTHEQVPETGVARLYTHLRFQDEQPRLFGFTTRSEREVFLLLNGVAGIGPATALGILSSCSVAELRAAVVAEDLAFLKKLKGVGPKTAQRIVLELGATLAAMVVGGGQVPASPADAAAADAVLALVSLGFPRATAEKAVTEAARALGAPTSVPPLVKEALRHV